MSRFWYRVRGAFMVFWFLLAVAAGSTIVYLGVLDRDPIVSEWETRLLYDPIRRGRVQEISWSFLEHRYCRGREAERSLISGVTRQVQPLEWGRPSIDRMLGYPARRYVQSLPIRIPRSWPPGETCYKVRVYFACNPLQEMLPLSWRIIVDYPLVCWTVEP